MKNFDHILVFKTNIKSQDDIQVLQSLLDTHDEIEQWNVDLNDEDCVLRVVTYRLSNQDVIDLVCQHGYACAELQ